MLTGHSDPGGEYRLLTGVRTRYFVVGQSDFFFLFLSWRMMRYVLPAILRVPTLLTDPLRPDGPVVLYFVPLRYFLCLFAMLILLKGSGDSLILGDDHRLA